MQLWKLHLSMLLFAIGHSEQGGSFADISCTDGLLQQRVRMLGIVFDHTICPCTTKELTLLRDLLFQ